MSSTVVRSAQKPIYKDYVNFLENYKSGGGGGSENSNSATSSRDAVDNSTIKFQSYNDYLNNYNNKKFNSVKPQLNENVNKSNNKTMKSEIFIEIQEPNNKKINEKISIFQNENTKQQTPLVARTVTTPPPPPPPPLLPLTKEQELLTIPPPPPVPSTIITRKQEPMMKFSTLPRSGKLPTAPPPPPPLPSTVTTTITNSNKVPISTMTTNKSPLTNQRSVDKNDPRIRKLVNGALRDLYGAYHDRANDIVATLPRSMVKKNNNIQNIINDIALRGDLEKLNGRVNPKSEQE